VEPTGDGPLDVEWHVAAAKLYSRLYGQGSLEIERVLRPVVHGTQRGLRPLRMLDGEVVDLRQVETGDAWRALRQRTAWGASKLGGNAEPYGVPAQHDRKLVEPAQPFTGYDPLGMPHTVLSRRHELPALYTSLGEAGAVAGLCFLLMAMAEVLIVQAGGCVAHMACDSLLVPCSEEGGFWPVPGGPLRDDQGREAVGVLTPSVLRGILRRFDPLFGEYGPAWREECDSLTQPTIGVVVGTNKVLLGQHDDDGTLRLVWSSDAGLGELQDPTGTGDMLSDGRWAWSAKLEESVLRTFAKAEAGSAVALPQDLPEYARNLALRPERAARWEELTALRDAVGDQSIGSFARFLRCETGGSSDAPVALGACQDPQRVPTLDYRLGGHSVRLETLDEDGRRHFAGGDPRGRRVVVRTVADRLARWMHDHDPSTTGPRRGLRKKFPVETAPSLVRLSGIVGDPQEPDRPPLDLGSLASFRVDGHSAAELADAAGLKHRSAQRYVSGERLPKGTAEIALATAKLPERRCAGCGGRFEGRRDKRWCKDACRKRWARDKAKEVELVEMGATHHAIEELARHVDGLNEAVPAMLQSARLATELGRCTAQGMAPEQIAGKVAIGGSLISARNPVGALVARVKAIADTEPELTQQRAMRHELAKCAHEAELRALVAAGALTEHEAAAELGGDVT
jgi:hypothetical protein